MNTLKHKGFIGSIEINQEDNTLYGKVLGLDKKTLITYEGNTVSELKEDFKESINDYIEHCKAHGVPIHKSYSGTFNIRITPKLHAKIVEISQQRGLSLNAFVKETLQNAVAKSTL